MELINTKTCYQAILQLRNQLNGSVSDENAVLKHYADIIDPEVQWTQIPSFEASYTDAANNLVHKLKLDSSGLIPSFTDDEIDINTGESTHHFYLIPDIRDDTPEVLINAINSLTDSADANEAIMMLNDQFMMHSKVNISIITSALQDYANTNAKQYGQIISSLAPLTDNEGNITQLSWIQWCKSVFSIGVNAGDNQSFNLDDTNPYKIIDFMNIMSKVFDVLVSTLFSAIAAVFRGLLGVFSMVISTIFGLWNSAKEKYGEVNIKEDEVLWHIAGAILRTEAGRFSDDTDYPGLCHYAALPGLDCYWWIDNNTLKGQCFFNVNIHPDRLYEYLAVATGDISTSGYISIASEYFMLEEERSDPILKQKFDRIFLEQDELLNLQTDGDFFRRAIAASMASVGLLSAYLGRWTVSSVSNYNPAFDDSTSIKAEGLAQLAAIGFCEAKYRYANHSYSTFSKCSWELLYKIHQWFFSNTNTSNDSFLTDVGRTTVFHQTPILGNVELGYVYNSPIARLLNIRNTGTMPYSVTTNYETNAGNSLDYFPVSPKIVLPQLNFEAILAWLIVSGLALTAIFIATSLVVRNKRIAGRVKRTRAANELQAKFNQAVDSGSKADINAYVKAQKKFNLTSKLFHWDSYDPQNKWWESRTSVSVLPTLLQNQANTDLLNNTATVKSAVQSNVTGFPKVLDNLSKLYKKMTGQDI